MRAEATTGGSKNNPLFHAEEADAITADLGSDRDRGLTSDEARARLAHHGPNVLEEKPARTVLRIVVAQFTDFMILVLIAAAVISAFLGDVTDTLMILAIVIINGIIGALQEYRSEKALAAVKKLAPARAVVIRDGRHREVHAHEIVPGDVVVLEAGAQVPADLRLLAVHQLSLSEAALTGESVPVNKHTHPIPGADIAFGDRRNMAFKGTTVAKGRGIGLAVATGMRTEIGAIAALLDTRLETETPLQRRLAQFGRMLAIAIVGICLIIFVAGLARGEPPVLMFLTAVTLAVAAIPEALPATVTIALAFGARRMAERKALVRRLSAVEGLGSVTYICSDKTGTLTKNAMTVEAVVSAAGTLTVTGFSTSGPAWRDLFRAMALNNDGELRDGETLGDPTETALLAAARGAGVDLDETRRLLPRVAEVPFDSDRKRMTTVHPASGGGYVAYTKGAPEVVIVRCGAVAAEAGSRPIDQHEWIAAAERMARDGQRVLAFAERRWPSLPDTAGDGIEDGLTFLGLTGMIDPPREETQVAVAACTAAGITPVMITGDHAATARAIAARLGILNDGEVVTGRELAKMSEEDLAARASHIRVYARVDPAQKIRVVEALQRQGAFVAVTGDGVNDAPALRQADIGVAMGKGGTDVAREVADLVLLDDNFATIVAAVREGRRIYDNLRKVISYVMTGNSAEIMAILLAPFVGLPLPLQPVQILWVNLLTDGLPALALTAEGEEVDIMRRPPRPPDESPFSGGVWQRIIGVGLLTGALTLAVQAYAVGNGLAHWQTMVFTVLTFAQAMHALALRSERQSLFAVGLLSNRPMLGAVASVIALQLAVVYVPLFQPVFGTAAMSLSELAICVAGALIVLGFVEAWKAVERRRQSRQ